MSELDDHELMAQYAQGPRARSEMAFAALAERYVNLVFSTARRSVGNTHAAEEITQAVFIILANKAGTLSRRVVLSGWLYQTTRLTAANFLRGEIRRQKREQEAFMQSTLVEPADDLAWRQIAPLLDDALGKLDERDRNAIVLRFFENKNLREVGLALGASEDAAKMRVNRALGKLRKIFGKRGASVSVAAIAGAVSVNSVQAAPMGLAKTISAVAIAKGATAGGSTLILAKGVLKLMAWSKMQTAAVVIGVSVLLATGTATVVIEKNSHPILSATNLSWADDPRYWAANTWGLSQLPPGVFIFRPTRFPNTGGGAWMDNRMLAMNFSVNDLIGNAYGMGYTRTLFPPDLPQERFDVMSTVAGGAGELLKSELKKRFGVTAHRETREADVLFLKVADSNPPDLKRHQGDNGNSSWIGGNQEVKIINQDLSGFFSNLESVLGVPVINQTGLSGNYDLQLKWQPNPGETVKDAYKRALLEQLGLELVPAKMPIDTLVVTKADN